MPVTLTTTRELAGSSGVKCAIYSRGGLGKTLLCATAPNPLIISAEKGMLTLRHYDVPVIEVQTMAEMWEVFNWLKDDPAAAIYQTICIDTVSEIAEKVLTAALPTVKNKMQAYNMMLIDMVTLLKAFRDLLPGRNVVALAEEGFNKDEITGVSTYGPTFPGGKLIAKFPHIFDEMFQITFIQQPGPNNTTTELRVLKTQPDLTTNAKDRSGCLDPLIAIPEMRNGQNSLFLTAIFNQIMADINQQPAQ